MDYLKRPPTLQRAVQVTLQNYGLALMLALSSLLLLPWWLQWWLLYAVGATFVGSIIAPVIESWRPKPKVPPEGKAVFISGCDSGFGHQLAQRLDDLGLLVFAGCLRPESESVKMLEKSCSDKLHIVPLDVTSDDSVQNAANYVFNNIGNKKLWAVVNNAGLNEGAEIMWTPLEVVNRIFDVNTFGVIRLTKAFLLLLCKDKGRIVTVASSAGRYTLPGMIPYCITKQATVGFCEGLRIEMYRFGVKVITIEPYMYKTPINDEERILSYITKTWEDAPLDVKEMYPENYLQKYKRVAKGFLRLSISNKPQEVVTVLEEAVMALDPKYSYDPGTLFSKLFYPILAKLPKQFADAVLHEKYAGRLS